MIVSIVTPVGEFVGETVRDEGGFVFLKKPRLFTQNQQGMGFLPFVCITGKQEPEEVPFNSSQIVFAVETNDEVAKAWRQATSSIVLP